MPALIESLLHSVRGGKAEILVLKVSSLITACIDKGYSTISVELDPLVSMSRIVALDFQPVLKLA